MNQLGPARSKKTINLYYWLSFFVGVIALTEFFGGYKYIQSGETIKAAIYIPLTFLVFLISFAFMAFQIYLEEREKGNLKSEFFFFEWIISTTARLSSASNDPKNEVNK